MCDIIEGGSKAPETDDFKNMRSKIINASKNLPTLHTTTRDRNEDTDDRPVQGNSKKRRVANNSNQLLVDNGFVVKAVPDFGEDKEYMKPLSKEPDHIRTVWRRNEPSIFYIAKRVRWGSREVDILAYLKKIEPQSEHIITLIDSIQSPWEKWIILPKLQSISTFALDPNSKQAYQFSQHLVAALSHLHKHKIAHLDVKPGNLVFNAAAQSLVLLDFDTAIILGDENEEVDGYRGTEGWTAPELGNPDDKEDRKFKPIPADLWACGRVINFFFGGGEVHPFRELTQRLDASPDKRPSMMECLEWIRRQGDDEILVEGKPFKRPNLKQSKRMLKRSLPERKVMEPLKRPKPKQSSTSRRPLKRSRSYSPLVSRPRNRNLELVVNFVYDPEKSC